MEFTYGTIVDALPEGYVPRQQWPEYDYPAQVLASMHPRLVGTAPAGIQWGWWPIMFEEYVGDDEPAMTSDGPNRIVIWRRLTRKDRPKDWYQISRGPGRIEGFAVIENMYRRTWSESARRYARKWETHFLGTRYDIVTISFEEFLVAYRQSTVAKKAHDLQLNILERMLKNPACAPHIVLWGARSRQSGELIAGLATITSPTYRSSYYQAGFIRQTADQAPAMVGLMDHWFATAKASGTRYLMFGGFWHPGLSKKVWGGFSSFKAKFGLRYIAYTPPLVRFKRGAFLRKS